MVFARYHRDQKHAMIARFPPFTLRDTLARASLQLRNSFARGSLTSRWHRMIAELEDWWITSYRAWRSEILAYDQPERFRRVCDDCAEETPHEGFDEFGAGWFAQVSRCRYCGAEHMKVWLLGWW